jgi:predicted aspartyl protease
MMQLTVRIGDQMLGALVDSGSTHSFTSATTACRLHLEPLLHPGLRVTVANGDCIASTEICRGVHVFIDDEEFITDLFIIPFGGYNMVLGVQWLHTLGPILWDFEQCHMSYWRDDHLVWW